MIHKRITSITTLVGIAATCGIANAGVTQSWGGVIQPGATGFISIDLDTGDSVVIQQQAGPPAELPSFTAMDYDSNAGVLYAIERSFENLVTIDPTTGDFTVVGPTGLNSLAGGAAYDSNTGTFYFADNSSTLYTIDLITGAATEVGQFDQFVMQGLAFDPFTNTLYGTDSITDSLYTLDTTTGASTLVGNFGINIVDHGLAFNEATGELLLSTGSAQGNNGLYNVDISSGELTFRAPLFFGAASLAIAQVPAPGAAGLFAMAGLALNRRRRG